MDKYIPTSAQDMLNAWDAGKNIQTISMGGLGDGYEMAIHCAAMEALRAILASPKTVSLIKNAKRGMPFPQEVISTVDNAIFKADEKDEEGKYKLGGLSGAQHGAAKQVAIKVVETDYKAISVDAPEDRRIYLRKQDPVELLQER